jgi:NAD(P)-dependent dehydrogenase (short-subunit alcohol dehydrogenase family)
MKITGKRVFITGGAVRIGASLVKAFASAEAKVAFSCNQSPKEALQLLSEIGGEKKGHCTVKADFSGQIPQDFFSRIGKIDILINNASVYFPGKFTEETPFQIETQLRVNFTAPLLLSKLFAEQKKLKEGCIINILDARISDFARADGSYWLSKKCLFELTKQLAVQLAPKIRVNALAPGALLPPAGGIAFSQKAAAKATTLKRLPKMRELVNAALFLVGNDAVTGQTIFIDGGRHLL